VNRYIVSRGEDRSVVLYWYQTPKRVIASEYAAKVYLVADSIRYRRTDTALVRIVVPVINKDDAYALKTAIDFAQTIFPPLKGYLPS
jgi:EpsI family protein